MRTKIKVYAALLSLGFVVTAWASPGTLPVPPAQEMEAPALNKPQQKPVTPPLKTSGSDSNKYRTTRVGSAAFSRDD